LQGLELCNQRRQRQFAGHKGAKVMTHDHCRQYLVLQATKEVTDSYFANPDRNPQQLIARYVAQHLNLYEPEMKDKPPFTVTALPSNEVFWGSECPKNPEPSEVVVALDIVGNDSHPVKDVLERIRRAVADEKAGIFVASSADIPFASSDHWCMGDAADPVFADRSAAERLLRVDDLRTQSNTAGAGVNVVIVDQGLDRLELGPNYGGGWTVGNSMPGAPPPRPGSIGRSHGMMMAHNILKVAPKAMLFDLPLAPAKISNIMRFLCFADAAYQIVLADIAQFKQGMFPGPWILVNPWGIFDRRSEIPLGDYTTNPINPFNKLVVRAVGDNIDVIFAAGNCGQFCADFRCGGEAVGPGFSIWGANSLEQVLTVGAVRADGMWLGYSSQGPGQPALGANKPDLCATSQFGEDADAFSINTGTSAACGLAAGVVAALRSQWNSTRVPPGKLKQILNQTARKPHGVGWNNSLGHRFGNGVLDARAAYDELKSQFPIPLVP
jgi:hypothetical protein